jgi:SulP family sulfate permease
MKQQRDLEFSLRELAGSLGDFGTLFPLAIGLITVNHLDPAGLFVALGLTNIALGLLYRLPMPLQPKKVIAVAAIAQRWPAPRVYASGLGLGLTWFVLVFSGALRRIVQLTPVFAVRGVQLALGVLLALEGLRMMQAGPLLGLLAILIVVLLRENRYAPAALVLVLLGLGVAAWRGDLRGSLELAFTLPPLTLPRLDRVWEAMLMAGFAQIPLSITNAIIATAALIRDYFPDKAVSERRLMLNMGIFNTIGAFFGGMPMCHGAGGLAAQVYYGARTGGASVLEGAIELFLGLFLSRSVARVMAAFPMPLVGGMMLLVGIQLGLSVVKLRGWKLWLAVSMASLAVLTNMAVGFVGGLGVAYLVRQLEHRGVLRCLCPAPRRAVEV